MRFSWSPWTSCAVHLLFGGGSSYGLFCFAGAFLSPDEAAASAGARVLALVTADMPSPGASSQSSFVSR